MIDFMVLVIGILESIFGFLLLRKYYYRIRNLRWYDLVFLKGLNLFLLSLILFGIGIAAIIHEMFKLQ